MYWACTLVKVAPSSLHLRAICEFPTSTKLANASYLHYRDGKRSQAENTPWAIMELISISANRITRRKWAPSARELGADWLLRMSNCVRYLAGKNGSQHVMLFWVIFNHINIKQLKLSSDNTFFNSMMFKVSRKTKASWMEISSRLWDVIPWWTLA